MKDDSLKDYVHVDKPGDGTFIYVIDCGVAYNVKNVSILTDPCPEMKLSIATE